MKTYEVRVSYGDVFISRELEAESKEEAIEQAMAIMEEDGCFDEECDDKPEVDSVFEMEDALDGWSESGLTIRDFI